MVELKIKAAVARSYREPLSLEGVELGAPYPDEIVVRLVACGVGSADLRAIDGRLAMPLPFVPGSEGAGIVEHVGRDVTGLAPGDSVIVTFDFCGHCEQCSTGHPRACVDFAARNLSGRRLDGTTPFVRDARGINGRFFGQSAFGTHLICRHTSAVKVPKDAPLELLACLGGEVMLGAGTILHGFRLRAGDSLLIVGADTAGLAACMTAKACGATTIVVVDEDESRRALASDLGATLSVHAVHGLADMVRSLAGDGLRFALDTTGGAAAAAACMASLTPNGVCALVDPPVDVPVDFEDQATEGRRLLLSVDGHAAPDVLIPELLALHKSGGLPLEKLVNFFAFEHVNDAIDASRRRAVVKPVLRFSLGAFDDLDRALEEGAANDAPMDDASDPTREVGAGETVKS